MSAPGRVLKKGHCKTIRPQQACPSVAQSTGGKAASCNYLHLHNQIFTLVCTQPPGPFPTGTQNSLVTSKHLACWVTTIIHATHPFVACAQGPGSHLTAPEV